jgi:hypothetical protein
MTSVPHDVPTQDETLPDGRGVLVIGDRLRFASVPFDDGPASVACCLRVAHVLGNLHDAISVKLPLSLQDILDVLLASGLSGSTMERADSLEELAQVIEDGAAVIASLDAGALWQWQPAASQTGANHTVLVVAVARDNTGGEVISAFVDDPARPGVVRLVDHATLLEAWLIPGGWMVSAR